METEVSRDKEGGTEMGETEEGDREREEERRKQRLGSEGSSR